MKRTFTLVIEKDPGGGYVASVAELPGCLTQAETLPELRVRMREAIGLYLEDVDLDEPFPDFVGVERLEVET